MLAHPDNVQRANREHKRLIIVVNPSRKPRILGPCDWLMWNTGLKNSFLCIWQNLGIQLADNLAGMTKTFVE